MNVNNVSLECTAVKSSQYPIDGKHEIAFVGRSNVGKSSLINYLVNRKSIARVSSVPGKTRGINFYNVESKLYFVDLPGYGYAKVSKEEQEIWGKMINEYFAQRKELKLLILLTDIRHSPTELDKIMVKWIEDNNLEMIIAATKADKIAKKDFDERILDIKNTLGLTLNQEVIPVSSEKRFGKEVLWDMIDKKLEI